MHYLFALINFLSLVSAFALGGVVAFFPDAPGQDKPIPGGSPLFQCDTVEKQLLKIENIVLSPNPPIRGENLTISAVGELLETVDEGSYIDVEVRLGYIKLLSQTYDLCESLEENDVDGLTCPLSSGQYSLVKEVEVPAEVPPGKYVIVARAYSAGDDLITCVTGEVTFPAA
ncbi:hypothetical protein HG535_0C02950 [Zygotorulaspora mrakii]|uniref:Phosphatidylglycerol/phosphatidylinositol transfer protein n=1 Tax=Zygotorulaspora mrakii TaxID=42260 RepID=A0A7H9B0B9_ZYGMR|nr:uncharacterized protein HG535_0C02950 [Zygotorulaspora mrakii]QLG71943.1 hypothetical protein HG535_0C02950 [Zygotorulaspora mrakii]